MTTPEEVRREIVRVCARLDTRQYVAGTDGNVSALLGQEDTLLITPSGRAKGEMVAEDLLLLGRAGKVREGRGTPSSETGMHLRIYDLRPDVKAVVHAHPPVATGFAAAGADLSECVLPEVILGLGGVPVAAYGTPGTEDLSRSLDPWIADHDAVLLANHGVVTVGSCVSSAYRRMETVEHAARVLLVARLLGGAHPLGREQVERLLDERGRHGIREGLASCGVSTPRSGGLSDADRQLAATIADRVRDSLRGDSNR
ncbi:MAG: class II aldolase/adducin family protein [Gemmatimonadota bacterium]|nr:class II aldolase/adducin family protein [Gemmatimonadota bacterium]MDP7032052.1 class II aldolase/adducin family protein [Gemmatimonadota bacterium]